MTAIPSALAPSLAVGVIVVSTGTVLWWKAHARDQFFPMFVWGAGMAAATYLVTCGVSSAATALRAALISDGAGMSHSVLLLSTVRPLAPPPPLPPPIPHAPSAAVLFLSGLGVALLSELLICACILAFVAFTPVRNATWDEAMTFGLSYGAVGVVIGVVGLFLTDQIVSINQGLPPNVGYVTDPIPVLIRLIPGIAVAAFTALLIIHAAESRSWKWFGLAYVYALGGMIFGYLWALVGLASVVTQYYGRHATIAILAIIGVWGMSAIRKTWIPPAT